jgi:hypothetical protein
VAVRLQIVNEGRQENCSKLSTKCKDLKFTGCVRLFKIFKKRLQLTCNVVYRIIAFRLVATDYKMTQAQDVYVCSKLYKNAYLLRQLFVRKFNASSNFGRLLKKYIRFIHQNTRLHLMHSVI